MQTAWCEDDESVLTYDSSATAISNSYLRDHERTLHRYVSESHLHVPLNSGGYTLDARHQRRLGPPQQPADLRLRKTSSPTIQHDYEHQHQNQHRREEHTREHARHSSSLASSIADNHLRVFPMPIPRHTNGALRSLPKRYTPELETLESPHLGADMEAAWEDASCVDGGSPRIDHSERLTGLARSLETDKENVADRFEVDALRRQVEQLQMALQLQSQQRELEQMALADAQLKRRTSQLQPTRLKAYHNDEWAPPPPAVRALPPVSNPAALRAALLSPAQSAVGSMLNVPAYDVHPSPADLAPRQGYYDRPTPRMFPDRRQSELSHASSPSLSASQTLVEEKKIEDLNRKVEALELMIEAMNHPPLPQARTSNAGSNTSSNAAFQYNPTRPRLASSASTDTSSTQSITSPAAAPKRGGAGTKLAAALGLRKASSSSVDVSTPGAGEGESRVSWSRKRTEKVAVPKAKVRQGPGRGRMVIRETAAN